MTTTATKFTTGPWHLNFYLYQSDPAAPSGRRVQLLADGAHVDGIMDGVSIDASAGHVCKVTRPGSATIKVADARLIAAAPEMYEALRELLAEHDSHGAHTATFGFTMARAALAKADGAA